LDNKLKIDVAINRKKRDRKKKQKRLPGREKFQRKMGNSLERK